MQKGDMRSRQHFTAYRYPSYSAITCYLTQHDLEGELDLLSVHRTLLSNKSWSRKGPLTDTLLLQSLSSSPKPNINSNSKSPCVNFTTHQPSLPPSLPTPSKVQTNTKKTNTPPTSQPTFVQLSHRFYKHSIPEHFFRSFKPQTSIQIHYQRSVVSFNPSHSPKRKEAEASLWIYS